MSTAASTTAADLAAVASANQVRYAMLVMAVQAKAVTPEHAAREVAKDLQAAGVDLKGGLKKWRTALGTSIGIHTGILEALERICDATAPSSAPTGPAAKGPPLVITVRQIGARR